MLAPFRPYSGPSESALILIVVLSMLVLIGGWFGQTLWLLWASVTARILYVELSADE